MELSTQMNVFEELLVPTKQETTDNINTNYNYNSNFNNLSFNAGFDHHHHQLFSNGWNIDHYLCFNNEEEDENTLLYSSSFMDLISQPPPLLLHQTPPLPPPSSSSPPLTSSLATTFDYPFLEALQEIIDSSSPSPPLMLPTSQEESFINPTSYPSPLMESDQSKGFSVGYCGGGEETTNKKKSKKLEGQPSKNLMAERRRRKRLNDRLSMLRSIVPKISKMDRTSILGDAIDYMKELLDKINKLQDEEQELGTSNGSHHSKLFGGIKDLNTNEPMVRNSPKFEVDRRVVDTRVDICCSPKPGLLLSTVNTLETLGLEIEQCVISCFSDFSLQASCSEAAQQRDFMTSEDIKQALFRNAGYGGNCL